MSFSSNRIAFLTNKVAVLQASFERAKKFEQACYKSAYGDTPAIIAWSGIEYVADMNDYYSAMEETSDAWNLLEDAKAELAYAVAWAKNNIHAKEFYEVRNRIRIVQKAA